jgi:putative adhesin
MVSKRILPYIAIGFTLFVIGFSSISASPAFERVNETGIRRLEVEASLLNVEINGGSGDVLTGWGEDIPKNVVVNYRRRGDVLRIWVEKRFAPFALRKDGRLFFEVPKEIDLDIRTSSGGIIIRNMESQNLFISSSSGDIGASRIESPVEVKSSSGDISLGMMEGDIRAESSSGRMELINVVGDVTATASSGDIRLSAVAGDLEISSTSGRIVLSSTNGTVFAHTSSGDIVGEDVRITGDALFKTSSGSIDIDFDNRLNDLSFRLTSSSGGLQVGDLKGERNLAAGEGTIRVSGESSSGDQSYR